MKKLILTITLILLTIIVANIGAWYVFPKHIFEISLIFHVWYQLFPNIPTVIYISSFASILIASALIRVIITGDNNQLHGYNKSIFQTVFGKEDQYGYALLIRSISHLKKFLKKLELNLTQGIILGKMKDKFIRSSKPYSSLILAPPGTGKTAAIIIPNLLLCKHSMLVHDPKGELFDITANVRRNTLNHTIFCFDPVREGSSRFNIFAKSILPKNNNDIKSYITNVSNIIFRQNNTSSSGGNYFMQAARSTFTFIAHWLIIKEQETSLPKIRSKLLQTSDVVEMVEEMIEDDQIDEELKQDGRGVLLAAASENQWAGVMGTLKEGLEIFGDSRIKNSINNDCDFTGNLLRTKKITVYLKVRDQDKKRLAPLISMMFEAISTQLISKIPQENDYQVTLLLDEFTRLGKIESLANLPAISRGYKLNSIFVAQDYEQISTTYGREYISIFETNCAYKIIFKQNNLSTAERLSKLIGNKTQTRRSKSSSKSQNQRNFLIGNNSDSVSTSNEGIALVTPQDILSLKDRHYLILVQGHVSRPILSNAAFWFEDKVLKELVTKYSP